MQHRARAHHAQAYAEGIPYGDQDPEVRHRAGPQAQPAAQPSPAGQTRETPAHGDKADFELCTRTRSRRRAFEAKREAEADRRHCAERRATGGATAPVAASRPARPHRCHPMPVSNGSSSSRVATGIHTLPSHAPALKDSAFDLMTETWCLLSVRRARDIQFGDCSLLSRSWPGCSGLDPATYRPFVSPAWMKCTSLPTPRTSRNTPVRFVALSQSTGR